MEKINEIFKLVNGIKYSRHIPEEAEKLAKENNIVVIVGGSDDLMYCYGAKSYLTHYCEHSAGWDGEDLTLSSDNQLREEAIQLGLKIFWCGKIEKTGETIEGYDFDKIGSFSYKVNDNIKSLDFIVMENEKEPYCTGIIIELPKLFKHSI